MDEVELKAAEASARWLRDEAVLAGYGFGAAQRTRFEEDRAKHQAMRVSRSQAVATRRNGSAARDTRRDSQASAISNRVVRPDVWAHR